MADGERQGDHGHGAGYSAGSSAAARFTAAAQPGDSSQPIADPHAVSNLAHQARHGRGQRRGQAGHVLEKVGIRKHPKATAGGGNGKVFPSALDQPGADKELPESSATITIP